MCKTRRADILLIPCCMKNKLIWYKTCNSNNSSVILMNLQMWDHSKKERMFVFLLQLVSFLLSKISSMICSIDPEVFLCFFCVVCFSCIFIGRDIFLLQSHFPRPKQKVLTKSIVEKETVNVIKRILSRIREINLFCHTS